MELPDGVRCYEEWGTTVFTDNNGKKLGSVRRRTTLKSVTWVVDGPVVEHATQEAAMTEMLKLLNDRSS